MLALLSAGPGPGPRALQGRRGGKGERVSPDELRGNLTLIDDASLFLLPLESDKSPAALLRGLFSRIVP